MKILSVNEKQVKENERYEVGSQTKMFTALLVLKAHEDKKLSIEDKIEKYLDDKFLDYKSGFLNKVFSAKGHSVKELVAHKVLLPDFINLSKSQYDDQKIFDLYKTLDFSNLTHETYQMIIVKYNKETEEEMKKTFYSNTGYYILTLLIEKIYGMSFNDAVQEYICKPLGMKNTNLDNSDTNGSYKGEVHKFNPGIYTGAGALVSTYEDLNTFILGINKIISDKAWAEWKELALTNPLGAGLISLKALVKGRMEVKEHWWGHLGQSLQFQSGTFISDSGEVISIAYPDASHKVVNDLVKEISE